MRNYNRIGDKAHSIVFGYVRFLVPWTRGNWWAWNRKYGLCLVERNSFHNCTATGIY